MSAKKQGKETKKAWALTAEVHEALEELSGRLGKVKMVLERVLVAKDLDDPDLYEPLLNVSPTYFKNYQALKQLDEEFGEFLKGDAAKAPLMPPPDMEDLRRKAGALVRFQPIEETFGPELFSSMYDHVLLKRNTKEDDFKINLNDYAENCNVFYYQTQKEFLHAHRKLQEAAKGFLEATESKNHGLLLQKASKPKDLLDRPLITTPEQMEAIRNTSSASVDKQSIKPEDVQRIKETEAHHPHIKSPSSEVKVNGIAVNHPDILQSHKKGLNR